ncbi:hypothetical protein SAMN05421823_10373 [Catalinimonas alkaloidigena]|uniref:DUF2071 domain-containing protein n=1 Tax=Catalinimonas alkaloidigena TaxID=1075417 RepID=A0A1G9DCC0_9BACT|nr:DUF2071 domain-containing protein [Catalinimonas alkaloidigena]SDK61538.1 hypothetical protein SAMN05421823_10373 [Catalinimonas alkaloidigena]
MPHLPFVFLKAQWRKLIMANYELPPKMLASYLPAGTQPDLFEGRAYMSLVGFLFERTKILGIPAPFHQHFEEFNLRFYATNQLGAERKRAVVFQSEMVPKPLIPLVANTLFNERYFYRPMRHRNHVVGDRLEVAYEWKHNQQWEGMRVQAENRLRDIPEGSLEEFITEHYWGYAGHSPQKTWEYAVEHPRWQSYPVLDFELNADLPALYGKKLGQLLQQPPASVYLLEGSEARIRWRQPLPVQEAVLA